MPRKKIEKSETNEAPATVSPKAKAAPAAGMPPVDCPQVIIETLWPMLDGGLYPVKREIGDTVEVWADIFTHGHEVVRAWVAFRRTGGDAPWRRSPLRHLDNDRWGGSFLPTEIGRFEYMIEAIRDPYLSWRQDFVKKYDAGQEVQSEALELLAYLEGALARLAGEEKRYCAEVVKALESDLRFDRKAGTARRMVKPDRTVEETLLGDGLAGLMERNPDFTAVSRSIRLPLMVDRVEARFAAWYEMFHRSQGTVPGKSATFDDMIRRLDEVSRMGFDVIYLPPVHPIGYTNRKGPNDSTFCPPGSPGSPWAVGSHEGGHDAIHPDLGTMADFEWFVKAARDRGMEIALDFVIQASPDHPWVKDHPEWFKKRPDGSIQYAENPPKKYQDVYPVNFEASNPDLPGLWNEMKRLMLFWIARGVKIFRVDNPHTKPLLFWQWLIDEVQRDYPEVHFLAEAFTRPKVMKLLAKGGFTQSYTYFTWRNGKQEFTEYLTELTQSDMKEYFRGNFFCNTPDILAGPLQGGRPGAFKMRAALAATLSPVWGIYNGFELCENRKNPKKEEYADNEKYEYKVWDWDRPGNIKPYVTQLNLMRRENPALHELDNLRFYHAENDHILCYGKHTPDWTNFVFCCVNLDPHRPHDSFVYVPIRELGIGEDEEYDVRDLVTGQVWRWRGSRNYVRLDPEVEPAHIIRIR